MLADKPKMAFLGTEQGQFGACSLPKIYIVSNFSSYFLHRLPTQTFTTLIYMMPLNFILIPLIAGRKLSSLFSSMQIKVTFKNFSIPAQKKERQIEKTSLQQNQACFLQLIRKKKPQLEMDLYCVSKHEPSVTLHFPHFQGCFP